MLNIGITGHRNLNVKFIQEYKKKIFDKLLELKQKDSKIILYSSLANGADRLVVNEALNLGIDFIAVLPISKKIYKQDFNTNSKIAFDSLVSKAKEVITMPNRYTFNRDSQYELAGHYISNNSDMLFALWDGEYNNLKGGTSEMVKYHLEKNKPLWHLKVDRETI